MNSSANSYLLWIGLILALLALYILPSAIAAIRGVPGLGWIILINLLPTGAGWLAALIAAVALPRRKHPAACQGYHPLTGLRSPSASEDPRTSGSA